jgi:hypothetical protein
MLSASVFFIEFEAFQHGNEDFHIKELCLMDAAKPMRQLHYIYRPPHQWESLSLEHKRTYNYQSRMLHRMSWNEGYTRFCTECLRRDVDQWMNGNTHRTSIIYVLGQQKVDYLQRLLPNCNIVNYQTAFNVTLKDLPDAPGHACCIYRNHGTHCAVLKCLRMYLYFVSLYI